MIDLRAAEEHAARPALVDGQRSWTHGQLHQAASQATRLVEAPDKGLVFLYCRKSPGTVITCLAALAAGHAVALVDGSLPQRLRRSLEQRYQPEWIVHAGTTPATHDPVAQVEDAHIFRREGAHGGPLHADLAVLLSTSGSTGSPKLVRLSASAVTANARSIAQALSIGPDDRAIASLPLQYAYGLSVLTSHLVAGGCLVLTDDSPIQRGFWQTFTAQGCTSYAGVPYSYQLLRRSGIERMPLPSLRVMTQAGGPLAPELVRAFADLMAARDGRFYVMYGQTEATARMAVLPPQRLADKATTVGRAIPEGTLTIEAADGSTQAPGVTGEIVYRGPNVMLGYAQGRADLARGDDCEGVLHTGDHGHLDADGYLTITGRSHRIGKVFGLRVNLDEVERLLHPRGPTAVIGGQDELLIFCEWGDPAAFTVSAERLSKQLRIHRAAFRFQRVASLPRTPSGKTDYLGLESLT